MKPIIQQQIEALNGSVSSQSTSIAALQAAAPEAKIYTGTINAGSTTYNPGLTRGANDSFIIFFNSRYAQPTTDYTMAASPSATITLTATQTAAVVVHLIHFKNVKVGA